MELMSVVQRGGCLRSASSIRLSGSFILLKRLPQPILQLRTIDPADTCARAVLEHYVKLAVRDWLQLHDALDVHDCRAMDAHESPRIEPLGKLLQRGAIKQ